MMQQSYNSNGKAMFLFSIPLISEARSEAWWQK
jgi:hypothetical protein